MIVGSVGAGECDRFSLYRFQWCGPETDVVVRCVVALLSRCVVASLRRCVVASLRSYAVESLLRRCVVGVVALLSRCVVAASLRCCVVVSLCRCVRCSCCCVVALLRCCVLPFPRSSCAADLCGFSLVSRLLYLVLCLFLLARAPHWRLCVVNGVRAVVE